MEKLNEKSKLDNSAQSANPTTVTETPAPAPVGWYYMGGILNPANLVAWTLGWKNSASGAGPAQNAVPATSDSTAGTGTGTPNKTPAPVASDVATPKNK